jgi:TPP-dependent pyruvate/acetoin dehydrogenase alpha subunit
VQVDGNSPGEVATAASLAVAAARSGTGPTFIEARTRRIVGHYIGDIQHYRPKGELEQDIAREPINRLRRELAAAGVPLETISAAENRARSEIEQAVQEALSSAPADTANAGRHLYA